MKRVLAVLAAFALFVALAAPSAFARPGGGHSFSSGSHSYSSGSHSYSSGSHSYSSGGSSWHSYSSGGSSSHSWSSSNSGSTTYGDTSYGSSPTPTQDPAYIQGIQDDSDCALQCLREQMGSFGTGDGGAFDADACKRKCVAEKISARAAAAAAAAPPVVESPPRPDPPLSRRLAPLTFALLFAGGIGGIAWGLRRKRQQEWATWADGAQVEPSLEEQNRYASVESALAAMGSADKGFSRVLLEDFLYALYAEVHAVRGGGKLARLGAYLGDRARAELAKWPVDAVDGIIVGSATIREVRVLPERVVRVVAQIEANYTERTVSGEASYYAREEWALERAADTPSRSPERARVIGCANCGAPLEKIVGGTCAHCGAAAAGAIDWRVADVVVLERETRGPILTGTTEEQGTEDPTLVAPDVKARFADLCARDPAVTWSALCARIDLIFRTFHRTWAAQELADVRPLLSDMLFETQRYWVAAYKVQGLRNVTEDPTIVTTQLSKVTRDAYFDAVTVRVFASCKDYTLDAAGKVVGGSRTAERRYTEYWTLIRSVKKSGPPKSDTGCPNCGAPLGSIGMSGTCASCGAKITTGDFDWVLSRIEQDEVYRV